MKSIIFKNVILKEYNYMQSAYIMRLAQFFYTIVAKDINFLGEI